jgi:antitoxin (DNA-binding transcriptional repressor) of toxin-antitoxin stability system
MYFSQRGMKMQTISASDLARNTSAILERVLLGESVSVMRNRTEIAHIVPARRASHCSDQRIADASPG